jgi:type I restriction enzyme S subunit
VVSASGTTVSPGTKSPSYTRSRQLSDATVPAHWQVRRLRTLVRARIANGVGESAQEFRPAWPRYVRITDIAGPRTLRSDTLTSLPPELAKGAVLQVGDLLIAAVGATYGKSYLHSDSTSDACFAGYLVRVSPGPLVLPEFLSYWTESSAYWDQVNREVIQATIQNFSASRCKSLSIALPPLQEQAAIVRFLNHTDSRIRRYISAKHRLIALLNEQRQLVVQRAAVEDVNPNVRRKSAPIEGMGPVPEHWQTIPARYVFREIDERSSTDHEELLSVSHLTGVTPRSEKNITMFMASSYVGHKVCRKGDLVINTMWAWAGALGIARQTGLVSPSYAVYRQVQPARLVPEYADHLLRTRPYVNEYVRRSTGITASRLRLYPDQFLNIGLVCPPLHEQVAILERVRDESAQIDRAIHIAQREIELIREFRTRTFSDVVSGKTDVRDAAAQLPDGGYESTVIEDGDDAASEEDDSGADIPSDPAEP